MGLPTPLTVESIDLFSMALGAVRRGDRSSAELAIMQAMERMREYDEARKDVIYALNTGKRRTHD